jgi:YebC/PmpR family DNA-binding regulatory protein
MSGHSHYATIKRAKEANDSARGKVYSKLAREISIAAKQGGSIDPDFNYKLRMVIEKARAANMPKDNIERALAKGGGGEALDVVTYEGFGPAGVGVMVEVATDNRNRTSQEIKNIFERIGGNMAGPGSVSFNFENKGLILIEKQQDVETQMLSLIDQGVEDMEETDDGIEAYVAPDKLKEVREKLEGAGFAIKSAELLMKPKTFVTVSNPADASKIINFLDTLNDHDDVQKVYANLDIPEEIISQIQKQ